LVRDIMSPSKS